MGDCETQTIIEEQVIQGFNEESIDNDAACTFFAAQTSSPILHDDMSNASGSVAGTLADLTDMESIMGNLLSQCEWQRFPLQKNLFYIPCSQIN